MLKTEDDFQKDKWKYLTKIPDNVNLMCVRFQRNELEKRLKCATYTTNVGRKLKYKKGDQYINQITDLGGSKNEIGAEYRVLYPDVVLTVHIHRGVKQRSKSNQEDTTRVQQLIPSNIMAVLGRQKLTDLRDLIRCVYDLTVTGDMSDNPDVECQNYAKDIFKSGFFFIENTFYNDMREHDARDYSKPLMDWAREPSRNLGPYTAKKMEETTFLDLNLRLGVPYVYTHQGDCEHLIVFTDLRLLTCEDPQDVREYPYLIRKYIRQRTLCRLCSTLSARWIIYGSEFTPDNPCFFCDLCFRSLHYDADNKKIGDFEAYRYFDHHAIV